MADQIIAYCGLSCSECDSYLATQARDMAALQQLAERFNRDYGSSLTAEDCLCDGCLGNGHKIAYCAECKIRACASAMGIASCAHCVDYGCPTLASFLEHAPQARETLERLRATLG